MRRPMSSSSSRTVMSSVLRSLVRWPSLLRSFCLGRGLMVSIPCSSPMASRAHRVLYCVCPYSSSQWLASQCTTTVSLLGRTVMVCHVLTSHCGVA
uniref:Uncharacterized protein n=1 Tax=Arundo donax TaxID=35708 RepID=A0A0A9DL24_ARUDO